MGYIGEYLFYKLLSLIFGVDIGVGLETLRFGYWWNMLIFINKSSIRILFCFWWSDFYSFVFGYIADAYDLFPIVPAVDLFLYFYYPDWSNTYLCVFLTGFVILVRLFIRYLKKMNKIKIRRELCGDFNIDLAIKYSELC